MQTLQNLRKRTGEIIYSKDGEKLDMSPVEEGDSLLFFHDNGADVRATVNAVQEEDIYLVTVNSTSGETPGIVQGNNYATHQDFVFVVSK